MRYVLLIQNDREQYGWYEALSQAERDADDARHVAWFKALPEGLVVGGEELGEPVLTRTVRRRLGQAHVSYGPFAETKEVLGGFIVIEAADIDAATAIAATWPGLDFPGGPTFEHTRVDVIPTAGK
jgi:hypothetical protein